MKIWELWIARAWAGVHENLIGAEPRGHHESGGDDPLPFTLCPVQQRRMDEGTVQLEGFSIVKRWPNRGCVHCQLPDPDELGASLFRLSSHSRPLDLDPSTRSLGLIKSQPTRFPPHAVRQRAESRQNPFPFPFPSSCFSASSLNHPSDRCLAEAPKFWAKRFA